MKIYAISDPHFSTHYPKPMDIFGDSWFNHVERIISNWDLIVGKNDIVLVPGDISWALKYTNALCDLEIIQTRPGTKILTKGNHDYWWPSGKRELSIKSCPDMIFLHGKTVIINDIGIAATRGWKIPGDSWYTDKDKKIYEKELRYLEDSLIALGNSTIRICMMHYPPFNDKKEAGAFVGLLKKYDVSHLVHGHLHGKDSDLYTVVGNKDGIHYHLTSADYLNFFPKIITII